MANVKSGINIFDSTSITIGNGSLVDGYIYIDSGSPHPYLRHNTTEWLFSNDGITESSIGTGVTSYTIGGILYANSSSTLTSLSIGSTNQVLTVSGGVPSWQTPSSGITDHNLLSNLQGGQADGYYHLTPSQYNWVVDGYSDGYVSNAITSLNSINNTLNSGGNIGIQETAMEAGTWSQSSQIFATSIPDDIVYIGNGRFVASSPDFSNDAGIAVSEDYGKTWRQVNNFEVQTLEYLENGYLFGTKDYLFGAATLYRSTDYGENWSDIGFVTDISYVNGFVNIGNGVVLAFGNGANSYNRISKSTNYGTTWTSKYYVGTTNSQVSAGMYLGNGIVVAHVAGNVYGGNLGRVIRSTDYGETWSLINAGTTVGISNNRAYTYLGNGIVLINTNSEMVRSTDYGLTWSTITRGTFNSGALINMGNGVVLGYRPSGGNQLYKSTDYGKTWSSATSIPGSTVSKTSAAYGDSVLCILNSLGSSAYVNRLAKAYDPAILINSETLGGTGQSTYTTGDLLYSNSTNNLNKLSIGTDGYILKVNSGIPSWQSNNHNNLSNIQGGTTNEYYHLTSAEHTLLTGGLTLTQVIVGKPGALTPSTDGYLISMTEDTDGYFPAYVSNTDGYIKNLTATMRDVLASGQTVQITVRKNNVDTSLTVTLDDATPLNTGASLRIEQNLINTVSVVNGDKINVRFISSATSDAKDVMVTFDVTN